MIGTVSLDRSPPIGLVRGYLASTWATSVFNGGGLVLRLAWVVETVGIHGKNLVFGGGRHRVTSFADFAAEPTSRRLAEGAVSTTSPLTADTRLC